MHHSRSQLRYARARAQIIRRDCRSAVPRSRIWKNEEEFEDEIFTRDETKQTLHESPRLARGGVVRVWLAPLCLLRAPRLHADAWG